MQGLARHVSHHVCLISLHLSNRFQWRRSRYLLPLIPSAFTAFGPNMFLNSTLYYYNYIKIKVEKQLVE